MGLSLMHISPPAFVQSWVDTGAAQTLAAREDYLTALIAEYAAIEQGGPTPRKLNPYPVCNPRVRIARGGCLFLVKTEGTQPEWFKNKPRGTVKHFSRAARNRAMQLLMSIDIDKSGGLPILVTLTYPNEYPHDAATTKGHLDAFLKRVYRMDKSIAGVWKVEPQQRGAPHYHILFFNTRYIDKDWVATAWAAVVDSGDAKHLHAGTRVEQVCTYNGVVAYAAKYICKRVEGDQNWSVGRWWGVHNRKGLHIDVAEYALTDAQYYKLRRVIVAYLKSKGVYYRSTKASRGFSAYLREGSSIPLIASIAE